MSTAWVDGGYNDSVLRHGARHSVRVEVINMLRSQVHVLPRRWVVERTFGWLMRPCRLVRDYETLPQRFRTMILWAMASIMSRFAAGESNQTWQNDAYKRI